jgi:leader peptidase (prepilin peptidase) / N-methyltransferase
MESSLLSIPLWAFSIDPTPIPESMARLIVLWMFLMGGAIGSFMNVVVYRLPLGLSLVSPPSRCPKCGQLIRWYDNVPILGWLMLRGRCRQCHNPISLRYPAVEGLVAVMFAGMALLEMPPVANLQLFVTCPFHLLLLCTLICAGLIEWDGHQPPLSLYLPALVGGVAMQVLWPALRSGVASWWGLPPSWAPVVNALAGVVLIGIFWWALRRQRSTALALSLICVAIFLGWQGLCVIALGTVAVRMMLCALGRLWPKLCVPPGIILGVLTFGWIVTY